MATSTQINALTALYVGYFDRAPDPAGLQFWIEQIDNGREFNTIAADFAASPEAVALYPYLTTPAVSSPAAFITSIYANLFGRAPDAAGLEFWTGVLNDGSVSVADMIEAIIMGARDDATAGTFDKTVLDNKVEVGLDFASDAANTSGFEFDAAAKSAAVAAVNGVTEDEATVVAAKAGTDAFLTGAANQGNTFTLTTAIDAVNGTGDNDIINGAVSATAGETTMTLADTIDGGAGVDTFNLLVAGNAAMPASGISNVEVFNIKNLTGAATAHDFGNVTGETQVWNDGSTVDVAVTGVDAVAVGVRNTATNMTVTAKNGSYAAGSDLAIALDGAGTKAVDSTITVGQAGAAGAATSASIAATGANFVTLAAGANAVSAANGIKTLTVTGKGSVDVDTTSDLDGAAGTLGATLTKVDASANTGGLTMQVANVDVAVTAGTGADVITLANGAALTSKASVALGAGDDKLLNSGSAGVGTSAVLDGGEGSDVVASTLLQVGNQANIQNFEVLDLAGESRTIDASLFKASTFESLELTGALGGVTTVQNLAGSNLNVNFTGGVVSYGNLTATLKDAATGTADAGTFTFKDGVSDIASLKTSGLETANIVSGGKAATDTNTITNYEDTLNSLTTITVTGANDLTIGDIDVNTAETAGALKTTAAALTSIDGSAATGKLMITAGADDTIVNVTTTYTGLTITGGSADDTIVNGAKGGIVNGGAGNDTITVNGSGAVVDTGAAKDATGDIVNVNGANASVTVGDLVQTVVVQTGANASAALNTETTITGAATGDKIDFTAILAGTDANVDAIANLNTSIASAASLTEALNLAANAGGVEADGSIGFFNWVDGNTYLVGDAAGTATGGLDAADAVVELVGTYTNFSATDGVVSFA